MCNGAEVPMNCYMVYGTVFPYPYPVEGVTWGESECLFRHGFVYILFEPLAGAHVRRTTLLVLLGDDNNTVILYIVI